MSIRKDSMHERRHIPCLRCLDLTLPPTPDTISQLASVLRAFEGLGDGGAEPMADSPCQPRMHIQKGAQTLVMVG